MALKQYLILFVSIYCPCLQAFAVEELVAHVKTSIEKAENYESKLNQEVLSIKGLTGYKVKHLLNNLCSLKNANYLEIGVWAGSTFIAATYKNQDTLNSSTAIDNWAFGSKNDFFHNTKLFLDSSKFCFYESDCFKLNLLENFKSPIHIYFYDGEHRFEDQLKAFTYFNPIFDNNFIAVVDDYAWPEVQKGTTEAFSRLGYNVVFETHLFPDYNGDRTGWRDGAFDSFGWWNGIFIAVVSKK